MLNVKVTTSDRFIFINANRCYQNIRVLLHTGFDKILMMIAQVSCLIITLLTFNMTFKTYLRHIQFLKITIATFPVSLKANYHACVPSAKVIIP